MLWGKTQGASLRTPRVLYVSRTYYYMHATQGRWDGAFQHERSRWGVPGERLPGRSQPRAIIDKGVLQATHRNFCVALVFAVKDGQEAFLLVSVGL